MSRATVVACVVAALSAGCATRGAVRQLTEDLRGVRSEVVLLRQAQDDLAHQLHQVTAAARAAQAKNDTLEAMIAATAADVERLSTRIEATDAAVKRVKEAVAGHATAASAPLPASVPERSRDNRPGLAEAAYAAGLANFRNREYGQAVLDFLDVVTKHSTHMLAPSAQYWIGEAYYRQKDYRQALVEFQRVIDWGPPNSKAPEALVKAGLCYRNLRETARAQEAWRRVLREFPQSPAADQARTLLAGKGPPPTIPRP
jgi:tol-pal system protein YbgF